MDSLKVIFEDESILVLDKPPGLITAPTDSKDQVTTLADIIQNKYGVDLERAGLVHRLDKDTSGILIIAKTAKALENLQRQFATREVKKEYIALVHRTIEGSGRVKGNVGRSPGRHDKFIVTKDGREAITEYEPIGKFKVQTEKLKVLFSGISTKELRKLELIKYGEFTLLKCRPKTGRTHQIRVHLKYIGYPIVGDEKYVGRKTFKLDNVWCPRQFLHASRIEFNHPHTGEKMVFESPFPKDLEEVLNRFQNAK